MRKMKAIWWPGRNAKERDWESRAGLRMIVGGGSDYKQVRRRSMKL